MLESRSNTDIHELAIEAPEEDRDAWRGKYERLASLPSIREERDASEWGFWPESLGPRDSDADRTYHTEVQLLDALVRTELDPDEAYMRMAALRRSPIYEGNAWYGSFAAAAGTRDSMRTSRDELLAVSILLRCAASEGLLALDRLRTSSLFDRAKGLWREWLDEEGPSALKASSFYSTEAQLLAAYTDGMYKAREGLPSLRAQAYDAVRNQWHPYLPQQTNDPMNRLTAHNTADQLYGILLETMVAPDQARASWERLIASPYYDASSGYWRQHLTPEQGVIEGFRTADQLLAIFVEAQIEKIAPRRSVSPGEMPSFLTIH